MQALALVRPGAAAIGVKACFVRRRRGLEPRQPLHPRLAVLLGDTENLMIYEDDALQVIQKLTGLSAPDADRFRRRVTKHRTEEEARALLTEFLGFMRPSGHSGRGADGGAGRSWPSSTSIRSARATPSATA